MSQKEILFLSELDEYSLSARQARALIQGGQLPAIRIGKKIRVRRIDVEKFFDSQIKGGSLK
jgi:excisionase family DNA binding protein